MQGSESLDAPGLFRLMAEIESSYMSATAAAILIAKLLDY